MTYRLIQHIRLSSNQGNITFTSIPQTFTDLYLVFSLRSEQGGFAFDDVAIRFNGDAGSNYPGAALRSREGGVGGFVGTSTRIDIYGSPASSATANTFGNGSAYIPGYRSSSFKSAGTEGYSENNSTSLVQGGLIAGRWNNTAAITSISILSLNGWNLSQNSTATLYGITQGTTAGVTVS
jgi:hypothetical protein